MDVGAELVNRALESGCSSIAVVGTGKNVGKTVTVAAVCRALERREMRLGVLSVGRDGEALDVVTGTAKPRLLLRPGALLAVARGVIPAYPALEILEAVGERGALGSIFTARVRVAGRYEIAGPSSAAGARRAAERLVAGGASFLVLDGAVDRLALLGSGGVASDGGEAVVLAVGAAMGATVKEVAESARALAAKLSLPLYDPARPHLRVPGALTLADVEALIAAQVEGEARQVVLRDATRVMLSGRAFLALAARLDLRCERALRPIAVTTASIGPGHCLEPRALLEAVARATGLPAYDVYAQAAA